MKDGDVRRAYAWAGETLWNQGAATNAENELGMSCPRYGDPAIRTTSLADDSPDANADKIHRLAAHWSLDPAAVQDEIIVSGLGVVGDLAPSRRR